MVHSTFMKCAAASVEAGETKISLNLLITLALHIAKSHQEILILRQRLTDSLTHLKRVCFNHTANLTTQSPPRSLRPSGPYNACPTTEFKNPTIRWLPAMRSPNASPFATFSSRARRARACTSCQAATHSASCAAFSAPCRPRIAEPQLRPGADRFQFLQLLQCRLFARRQFLQFFTVDLGLGQCTPFQFQSTSSTIACCCNSKCLARLIGTCTSSVSVHGRVSRTLAARPSKIVCAHLVGAAVDGLAQGRDFVHVHVRRRRNLRAGGAAGDLHAVVDGGFQGAGFDARVAGGFAVGGRRVLVRFAPMIFTLEASIGCG
jgi:hypothetical protein